MPFNSEALLGPHYATFGVPATLSVEGVTDDYELTVIDQTSGDEVLSEDGGVTLATIKPVCFLRTTEVAEKEIDLDTIEDATIEFNSRSWRVLYYQNVPTPDGEGQVKLILMEQP